MDARHGRIIMLGLLIIALMVSATSAFAIIVHDAQVRVGSTVEVPIEIDQLPYNLWYYRINLTNANPATGEMVNVTFPGWTMLTDNSTLPADTFWMKGGNLVAPVAAGTTNVSLGSFTVHGDHVGTSQINLEVNALTTDNGFDFPTSPTIVAGNLVVLAQLPGSIHVTSAPSGAEIWIDGADTGNTTESTIDGITPGDHTVKVTLAGYQDAEQAVTVVTGETVNADFTLNVIPPATGSIHITSAPSGAEIWIDNVDTGNTTESTVDGISPGNHTVNVTLAGYEIATQQTVSVVAGQTANADFTLVPLPTTGSIHVASAPSGAEIWIDGADTGNQTESTFAGISPGDHTVNVTLAGYEMATHQTVSVIAGETANADFTLVPLPTTGSIHVASAPSGAEIWIDNVDTGNTTESTFDGITPGNHVVNVTLAGYEMATQQTVSVIAGGTANANFTLVPLPTTGSIHVTSAPSGAEIWIDGADTGNQTETTFEGIAPGDHTVNVTLAGYEIATQQTVSVIAGQTANADFTLVPLPTTGSIKVTSAPSGAEIWIDGADTGNQTETTFDGIAPGDLTVNVTFAGYEMATQQTVSVIAGQTANADFTLVPLPTTGSIKVTSAPSGAEIWIDGADTGNQTESTFDGISPGDHTVNVTLAGYKIATAQTLSVVAGETVNADFTLVPLPTTGSIHVTSAPSGAEIWIDNVDTGNTTESTFNGITPGNHVVNVTLAGYEIATQQTVTVVAGQTANADFTLVPLPTTGSIHVTSVPSGAEIWIDGADTGNQTESTFDGIAPGDHTVNVTLAGYEIATQQTVSVVAGQTANADFTLVPLPTTGSIHVTSAPSGAEIWIDGADTGNQTETTFDGIAPGDHTVNVTLSGYEIATQQTVSVIAGATVNADFTLVPLPTTGSIHVTSAPSGAEIWIDNVDTGKTTESTIDGISPGDHTVNVTLAGYEITTAQTQSVVAGATVNADFTLSSIPPATGSIHVTSAPSGAEIWIDGADTGNQTESTFDGIAPGDHNVNVTLAGYEIATAQTLSVVAGETVNADFTLVPLPTTGSIHAASTPSGAEIWIDNVDTGNTTESTFNGITPGDHTVNVTFAGYEMATQQTVSVIAGETANADFTLVPLPTTGSIHVTSAPSGAEIWIDSADTGNQTETTFDGIAPGDHTVNVTLAGYKIATAQTLSVVAGETVNADFTLVKFANPPKAQFLAFPRQGTAPLSVLFLDLSRGSPTSRKWDFGDGSTSTEMFPIHTYTTPGTYTVKLTVSNSGGSDTMVRRDFITVRAQNPPKAQFIAFPRQGTAPLSVLFLDLSRGSPTSRVWDFGDGTTSSALFPIHTYAAPGKYTVKLTVSNSGGSDTQVRENFIIVRAANPPKAQFTAYPQDGTAPLAVTFLDLSRGYPSSRVWDFGDGLTSTDENPVHVYANAGKYTVTLTVTNGAGSDTAVQKNFINVAAVKVKGKENQDAGSKANKSEKNSGNNSPASGSNERPKIKIS